LAIFTKQVPNRQVPNIQLNFGQRLSQLGLIAIQYDFKNNTSAKTKLQSTSTMYPKKKLQSTLCFVQFGVKT